MAAADPALALGAALGKGAWNCDTRTAIPPEKEARRRGGGEGGARVGPAPPVFFLPSLILFPPPSLQAEVFEEIPTMEHAFHGIPTVPPRKDMSHMV
jgi:hypothetical protein